MKSLLRRWVTGRAEVTEPTAQGEFGLPCAVCGAPATGWAVDSSNREGIQVIDGIAACAVHQTESRELRRSKAG